MRAFVVLSVGALALCGCGTKSGDSPDASASSADTGGTSQGADGGTATPKDAGVQPGSDGGTTTTTDGGGSTGGPSSFAQIDPSTWVRPIVDAQDNIFLNGQFVGRKTPAGTSFTPYGTGLPAIPSSALKYGFAFDKDGALWTNICNNGVFKVPSQGGAWTQVGTLSKTACSAASLHIDGSGNAYIGMFSEPGVRKFAAGGTDWTSLTDGHEDLAKTITSTSNGDLFTGGSEGKGVYKLAAGSTTFALVNGSVFASSEVQNLETDKADNVYAYKSTVDETSGIFRLPPGGSDWTEIATPFSDRGIFDNKVSNLVFDGDNTGWVVGAANGQQALYKLPAGAAELVKVTETGLPDRGEALHLAIGPTGTLVVTTSEGVFISQP